MYLSKLIVVRSLTLGRLPAFLTLLYCLVNSVFYSDYFACFKFPYVQQIVVLIGSYTLEPLDIRAPRIVT